MASDFLADPVGDTICFEEGTQNYPPCLLGLQGIWGNLPWYEIIKTAFLYRTNPNTE